MPPRRTTRPNQATLSFGSRSRVSKPSSQSRESKHLDSKPVAQAEQVPVTPKEPSQPHVAEVAVRDQARTEIQQPWSEEDEKAVKVTEQDLERYWRAEEEKRLTPRGWLSHIPG